MANAYTLGLVWALRAVAILALVMDVWFLVDAPIGLDAETAGLNFSGPAQIWLAAPFLRSLSLPLLMLAAAEILRVTTRNDGNAR